MNPKNQPLPTMCHEPKSYLPIIGLEVHVELKTKSKMFCGCSAHHFLQKPNIHTCPVCLGLPGALPVPNKKAIDWCLLIGMALNCQIADESKFDRKNYFYPDLPKGYQISQYDQPFCKNGHLKLQAKKIRINRVHMEEDTAKLVHVARGGWQQEAKNHEAKTTSHVLLATSYTLIDFNRSGVPLVEIVSEPDVNSIQQAVLYLKKLQQIIRYLGVSDCDMEKGSMRCEANISLLKQPAASSQQPVKRATGNLPNYKVEIKNLNSFRFVKKAIEYEIKRQKQILESGKIPIQETRGFDEKTGKTYSQRIKEEAADYRYFPEPDIPPIVKLQATSYKLQAKLPELPDEKIERFVKEYGTSAYNAEILATTRKRADYFEEAVLAARKFTINDLHPQVSYSKLTKKIANVIVNKRLDIKSFLPAKLVKTLVKKATSKITDQAKIKEIVQKVLKENKKAVADYKAGKKQVIGFLIGQVMRELRGKASPQVVQKLITKELVKFL